MQDGITQVLGGTYRVHNGLLHSEDEPAITFPDGSTAWYLYGKQHRVGGPAVEGAGGSKMWFLNGIPHRVDGPAYIGSDREEYVVNGVHLDACEVALTESEEGRTLLVLRYGTP